MTWHLSCIDRRPVRPFGDECSFRQLVSHRREDALHRRTQHRRAVVGTRAGRLSPHQLTLGVDYAEPLQPPRSLIWMRQRPLSSRIVLPIKLGTNPSLRSIGALRGNRSAKLRSLVQHRNCRVAGARENDSGDRFGQQIRCVVFISGWHSRCFL